MTSRCISQTQAGDVRREQYTSIYFAQITPIYIFIVDRLGEVDGGTKTVKALLCFGTGVSRETNTHPWKVGEARQL